MRHVREDEVRSLSGSDVHHVIQSSYSRVDDVGTRTQVQTASSTALTNALFQSWQEDRVLEGGRTCCYLQVLKRRKQRVCQGRLSRPAQSSAAEMACHFQTCPVLIELLFGTLMLSSIQIGAGIQSKTSNRAGILGEGYSAEAAASLVDDLPGFGPPPSTTFSGYKTYFNDFQKRPTGMKMSRRRPSPSRMSCSFTDARA